MNILVVDDEPLIHISIEKLIDQQTYCVHLQGKALFHLHYRLLLPGRQKLHIPIENFQEILDS